jgi:1,4-alpha-glucan branching enzyme
VWPVGEEWLFQAWGGAWLRVTQVLLRLAELGHRDVLTLGVSPLTAWQLADRRMRDDLGTWLTIQMWRAEEQRSLPIVPDRHVRELGSFYWRHYADLLRAHEEVEAAGGLLAVWADLESRGVIELLGGPATHPYLPLVRDPDVIDRQLACGLDSHEAWAGRRPRGIWAPECGYRPRGAVADATATPTEVDDHGTPELPRTGPDRPGLEEHYARHGIDHFLVDAPTLVRAAGGPDRDWTSRPAIPDPSAGDPYEVVHDGVLVGDSDVAAFARDLSVAYHVWSPTAGYPGDEWYRDFHAHGSFGVHPSWRVTDKRLPPDAKAVYLPERAVARASRDADHLHGILREVLDPRPGGLVVAAYDTELFGHWWFEGPLWLQGLLERVSDDPALATTTLRSRLERRPPTRRLDLPESSWGYAKGHASWVTPETRWIWDEIARADARWQELGAGGEARVVVQAARELELLRCSDWPFMITRGKSPDYAHDRVRGHAARFHALCDRLEGDAAAMGDGEFARFEQLDPYPADVSSLVPVAAEASDVRGS